MQVRKSGFGYDVIASYQTDLNSKKHVIISVDPENDTINVAGTANLNKDGRKALRHALNVADAILENGWEG